MKQYFHIGIFLQVLELASDDCVDGFDDDENIYEPVSLIDLFDLI